VNFKHSNQVELKANNIKYINMNVCV